jgi:hypothetical protein
VGGGLGAAGSVAGGLGAPAGELVAPCALVGDGSITAETTGVGEAPALLPWGLDSRSTTPIAATRATATTVDANLDEITRISPYRPT